MKVRCPKCNKWCYEKSFRGSKPMLFNKTPTCKVEKGAAAKLGIPITRYESHKC